MKSNQLLSLKSLALAAVVGGVLVAPVTALAQFDFGGGQTSDKPWDDFKFNKSTKIKLDFRNANIDAVLSLFQKTSGITIVKDPSLTGPITLTSAGAITLSEAFQILKTTLDLKKYEMVKEGGLLVIRQKQQRDDRSRGGFDPSMMAGMFEQPKPVLKIYQIKYANATQVARTLNEVFATSGQPTNPFAQFFQQGGFGQNNNNRGGGRFGGGNQGRFGGGGGGFTGFGGGQSSSTVRASSDDFSNSVIVNASDSEHRQVADILKQIDKETDQPQKTKVFKINYASAQDIAPVVQNVLTNNAPRGRGGITNSSTNVGDRFQQALRFGSAQASFGTVAVEARSNSLVVTATEESLKITEDVIKELDQNIPIENTTFVFPLQNARAEDVSNLMNQAFGQRQGLRNTGTGRLNTPAQNRNTQTQNRQQTQNRAQTTEDPNSLLLDLENPENGFGDLATNVLVAQGGGFGALFGGQQNRAGQTQQQTARTADGRLVPVRDLTGQITAIPDNNTNSIIVVTTPDNVELLKSVLNQLDRIPEQVMIETVIVEASLDESSRLGVEFGWRVGKALGEQNSVGNGSTGFGLNAASTATGALPGFRYTLSGGNLTGLINAIQTNSKFKVLSTPRIFTSNNVQAQINISQRVPYITNTRQDINGGQLFTYAFEDVGIVLTVTPRITSNGMVALDVNQTANELQGFTDFQAPIINQREADTIVSVKDGETIILGGIIRNTVQTTTNKVPLLGDIPILGNLFKSRSKTGNQTELIVLLTPRIVRDPDEARKLRDDQVKKLSKESQDAIGTIVPPENKKVDDKKADDKKGTVPPPDKKGGSR